MMNLNPLELNEVTFEHRYKMFIIVPLKHSEAQEDDGDSTTSADGSETTEESAAESPDTSHGESIPEQV